MSLRLRPYAVDLRRLDRLIHHADQRERTRHVQHLVDEDAEWFGRYNTRHAKHIQQGAPTAQEALGALLSGQLDRAHHWSYRQVLERLCHNLGRILPNEHLKHLDLDALETLDAMLAWLDAPERMVIESFVLDGPPTSNTLLDHLNIPWLDDEACEYLDTFFADIDWDEREEELLSPDGWLEEATLWQVHLIELREIEACLHDTVQHASGLVLFQD